MAKKYRYVSKYAITTFNIRQHSRYEAHLTAKIVFFQISKFITEFISSIKNTKNVNVKGTESLEMAKIEKMDFLIF